MPEEALTFAALDGHQIGGCWFVPEGGPHTVAVISGAVAAPQKIYAPLARHLAERGYAVLTYDYRGVGASRPASLRGFKADLRDWAVNDAGGAIALARGRFGGVRLVGIGHSLGGQLLGLQSEPNAFARYAAVATLSGHWRKLDDKWRAFLRMNLAGVPTSYLFGYLPASLTGFGSDLPAGVFRQWARWCRHPDYVVGDPAVAESARFPRYGGPYLAIGATDDPWGNPRALANLLRFYTAAKIEEAWLEPKQSPLKRIGHFGFFRPENRETLWPVLTEWLDRR
jgi:predicted alpha/beta hydrolase